MQKTKSIHLHAKPIQRSKNHSSTAAAAYCSAEKIVDDRTGVVNDYTQKNGVDDDFIIGYDGSREELWNLAEQSEKRKDATTAKEFDIALPNELSSSDKVETAKIYAEYLHKEHGCAVDVCIHNLHGENPHAHVMMTTRSIEKDGTMSKDKIPREWSDKKRKEHGLKGRKSELEKDRKQWADASNFMLKRNGITDVKYDHRSYKDQGSKKKPTRHYGSYDSLHSRLTKQYNESVTEFNKTIDEIDTIKFQIDNLPPEPDISLTKPDLAKPAPDPKPVAQPQSQMPEPSPVKKPKPKPKKKEPEKKEPILSPKLQKVMNEMRYHADRTFDAAERSDLFPAEVLDRQSKDWNDRGQDIHDELTGKKKEPDQKADSKPQHKIDAGPKGPGM